MYALFDLDDTVHDKSASLATCATAMFQTFLSSTNISELDFKHRFVKENCIIQPKTLVFEKLANTFSINQALQRTMLEFFDESFHTYSQRFPNVIESMAYLKSLNVPIACVTNGRDFFQRNKIKALGLNEYFDVIVTSGALAIKKPDPRIFQTALNELGAVASESVFIGDNLIADIEPAKKLGMKTIWVNFGNDEKPDVADQKLIAYADFPEVWQSITR